MTVDSAITATPGHFSPAARDFLAGEAAGTTSNTLRAATAFPAQPQCSALCLEDIHLHLACHTQVLLPVH